MKPTLCVRIRRRDGMILRTTSHDKDIEVTAPGYEGVYIATSSLAPSEMQFRATLAVDGLDVSGILDEATGIPENEVAAGIYDMARITVFETDWSDPSEVQPWSYGVLGNKKRTEEGRLQMEIRTLGQLLNQGQGDVYAYRCRAELGSGAEATILRRCGVDMTAFTFEDDVTAVFSRGAFSVAGLTQDPGYFSKGLVEFLSGANAGAVREIRIHEAGGVMLLYDPVPYDIQIGDDVRVKAGCDKTRETCAAKFDNVVNFRGEPDIPGDGFMQRGTTQQPKSKAGGSSLLGSIVQLAATAIGSFFGPWGTFIGSMVGAILAPVSGGRSVGPRADDLRVTSSTSGLRIPYIAGRYFCDGNIIWAREIIEVETTRRVGGNLFSSGTKVTEYTYFLTAAVALCEGEISGIMRIWAYGKLIYDARPLAEREAEFLARTIQIPLGGTLGQFSTVINLNIDLQEHMTVYLGTADQEADPTIIAEETELLGSNFVGVPAYRGQAYVVFKELPLVPFGFGARVPAFRFEVCRPLGPVLAHDDSDVVDEENEGDPVLDPTPHWVLP